MFKQNESSKNIFELPHKQMIESDLYCVANQNLNLFEDSIKEAINKFEKKHNKYCKKASDISDKISKIEIKQSELNENLDCKYEELQKDKIKLYEKQHNYYTKTYWINEQLKSLSEMQIINTFKNIEINLKALIHISYPKINTKEFYKWYSFNFLKLKIFKLTKYKVIKK